MKGFGFFYKILHTKDGKSRCSLMALLSLCFFSFSFIMLVMLWMFQAVFLGSFYKAIKTKNITSCASTIKVNIDHPNVNELINYIAIKNDMCIVLCTKDSDNHFNRLYTANANSAFVIDHYVSGDLTDIYAQTVNNDGEFIDVVDHSEFFRNVQNRNIEFIGADMTEAPDTSEGVVYSILFKDSENVEYMFILDASITPTVSIMKTLRYQLRIATLIFVLAAVIMTFVFSKIIAHPLESMNKTAKQLAEANYDVVFSGTGYKEIEQLSDTMNYATHELSQVDQMRKDLIANVSHDLRTPLTLITGYGEVMRDIPGENTSENIQIIIDEATRLSSLVSDLIDISKIEAGTMKLEAGTFCITHTIEAMFGRYNKLKEQDGFTFTFDHEGNVYVYADELKISQVIYNLVNNAVNYSGDSREIWVRQYCYDN